MCNVVHPCGQEATSAIRSFSMPLFVCGEHEHEYEERGCKMRSLADTPGPWIEPSLEQKQGQVQYERVKCEACGQTRTVRREAQA
jgi:hypothetical protein